MVEKSATQKSHHLPISKMLKRMMKAWRFYLSAPEGVSDVELAAHLRTTRQAAALYRARLKAVRVSYAKYTISPSKRDVKLAISILDRVFKEDKPNGN